jgi:hypothetical protein
MYAEGMKLAKRYEEEEAALAEQLTVSGWKGGRSTAPYRGRTQKMEGLVEGCSLCPCGAVWWRQTGVACS